VLVLHKVFEAGEGRCRVFLEAALTPDGVSVNLFGGERPHIGAVALCFPWPLACNPAKTDITSAVLPVPGHKDGELAGELAKKIARACRLPVAMVAGLHIDHALPHEIERLVEASHRAAEELIDWLTLQQKF